MQINFRSERHRGARRRIALIGSATGTPGADTRETIKPGQLPAGVSEATLCGLAGANYDDLPEGTYAPSVELPDKAPLFP